MTGSFTGWSISGDYGATDWQFDKIYTSQSTATLFPILFPDHPISKLSTLREHSLRLDYTGIDTMFIPYHCGILSNWLLQMICIINSLVKNCPRFQQACLWIPHSFLPIPLTPQYAACFDSLVEGWLYSVYS